MTRKEFENYLIRTGFNSNGDNLKVMNKNLDILLKLEISEYNKRKECEHDFTESYLNRSGEFMGYICSKCGGIKID